MNRLVGTLLFDLDAVLIAVFAIFTGVLVLAEADGELIYSSYCVESGYSVGCSGLIQNFLPLLIVGISGLLICSTIYVTSRTRSKPTNTQSRTPEVNTQ